MLRYSILDPTGNITALVESPVAVERQPQVAGDIMRRHPQVEQVGFVRMESAGPVDAELRMAGGEFCGNATMCTAALYLLRQEPLGVGPFLAPPKENQSESLPVEPKRVPPLMAPKVVLRVSGAQNPIEVRLTQQTPTSFTAQVHMPPAMQIIERTFAYQQLRGTLPVVFMEGISHVVVPSSSPFFALLEDPWSAEQAVCAWCETLGADGLGLMFLEDGDAVRRMTPLVYVPGSDTVFWENSCASGSSAVGMYLAAQAGAPVSLTLQEPGGSLHVTSDPASQETWLQGSVRLVKSH